MKLSLITLIFSSLLLSVPAEANPGGSSCLKVFFSYLNKQPIEPGRKEQQAAEVRAKKEAIEDKTGRIYDLKNVLFKSKIDRIFIDEWESSDKLGSIADIFGTEVDLPRDLRQSRSFRGNAFFHQSSGLLFYLSGFSSKLIVVDVNTEKLVASKQDVFKNYFYVNSSKLHNFAQQMYVGEPGDYVLESEASYPYENVIPLLQFGSWVEKDNSILGVDALVWVLPQQLDSGEIVYSTKNIGKYLTREQVYNLPIADQLNHEPHANAEERFEINAVQVNGDNTFEVEVEFKLYISSARMAVGAGMVLSGPSMKYAGRRYDRTLKINLTR